MYIYMLIYIYMITHIYIYIYICIVTRQSQVAKGLRFLGCVQYDTIVTIA